MIRSRKGSIRVLVACLTVLIVLAGLLSAKPPSLPRPGEDPVGFEHWQATGQYAPEFTLRKHLGIRRVLLSGGGRPSFKVNVDAKRKGSNLQLDHGKEFPETSAHCNGGLLSFDLGGHDVVPIYDQVYRVTDVGDEVNLTRVTEKLPAEIQPSANSRMISLAESSPSLFCGHYYQKSLFEYCDTMTLDIDPQTLRVKIQLVPQGKDPPGQPPRKVMNLTVGKGELLSARGRAYRVLNVVPPQEVDGVGKVVGWIEISADPVEASEE